MNTGGPWAAAAPSGDCLATACTDDTDGEAAIKLAATGDWIVAPGDVVAGGVALAKPVIPAAPDQPTANTGDDRFAIAATGDCLATDCTDAVCGTACVAQAVALGESVVPGTGVAPARPATPEMGTPDPDQPTKTTGGPWAEAAPSGDCLAMVSGETPALGFAAVHDAGGDCTSWVGTASALIDETNPAGLRVSFQPTVIVCLMPAATVATGVCRAIASVDVCVGIPDATAATGGPHAANWASTTGGATAAAVAAGGVRTVRPT